MAKDELLQQRSNQCEGDTKDGQHQIGNGQIEEETVGHVTHPSVHRQGQDDKHVADDGHDEDNTVGQDQAEHVLPVDPEGRRRAAVHLHFALNTH